MAKVLVVDDSILIRRAAQNVLSGTSHELITANNGQEAIEVLKTNPGIDIIFSDVNMPIMNGIEMCQTISQNPALNKIPIVMLTTESGKGYKDKAKGLGIKAWMVKPFDKEKFLYAIDRLT